MLLIIVCLAYIIPDRSSAISLRKLYFLAFTGALNDVWDFTESYLLLSVWQNRFYVYTTAAVLIGVWCIVNMLFKKVIKCVYLNSLLGFAL